MLGEILGKEYNRLPKDVDFAAGFFTTSEATKESPEEVVKEKVTAPIIDPGKSGHKEGVSKKKQAVAQKNGLKTIQFKVIMNPEMYEKLRIIAEEQTNSNFSRLIDEAVRSYC